MFQIFLIVVILYISVSAESAWCNMPYMVVDKGREITDFGGITRLVKYGLKADGTYGKVDYLHITYDGNRIATVRDDAGAVTQAESMDYPSGDCFK